MILPAEPFIRQEKWADLALTKATGAISASLTRPAVLLSMANQALYNLHHTSYGTTSKQAINIKYIQNRFNNCNGSFCFPQISL